MALTGKRIACLIGDDYEDLEVWYPVLRLQEEGAEVDLVGQKGKTPHRGKYGYPGEAQKGIDEVKAADYDGLIVPGGWMPDKLRRDRRILDFCRDFDRDGKIIATICHGPWILISAHLVRGKTMTSTPGIKDDVENAGAIWVDQPAVRDGNIISARRPPDLPAWCKLLIGALEEK